jgi:hypothetical protein
VNNFERLRTISYPSDEPRSSSGEGGKVLLGLQKQADAFDWQSCLGVTNGDDLKCRLGGKFAS